MAVLRLTIPANTGKTVKQSRNKMDFVEPWSSVPADHRIFRPGANARIVRVNLHVQNGDARECYRSEAVGRDSPQEGIRRRRSEAFVPGKLVGLQSRSL